jgi:hypothetical protein
MGEHDLVLPRNSGEGLGRRRHAAPGGCSCRLPTRKQSVAAQGNQYSHGARVTDPAPLFIGP